MDWSLINKPFGWIMEFCLKITGNYYVFALFFFALIMQIVLIPLAIKQHKSQMVQRKLRPKELAIRKKYAGRTDRATQQKMTLEIQEMHKNEGYSQLAGCLPMLIQLPIIFILFAIVRQPISYSSTNEMKNNLDTLYKTGIETVEQYQNEDIIIKGENSNYAAYVDELNKAKESLNPEKRKDELLLTKIIKKDYDYFTEIADKYNLTLAHYNSYEKHSTQEQKDNLPNFSFFGKSLLDTPPKNAISILHIIPIIIFITSYFGGVINRKYMAAPVGSENNPMVNGWFMKWGMPAMSTWFAFTFPAAVGVYWVWRTITGAAQPIILNKIYPMPVVTDAEIVAAEKEFKVKKKKKVIMIEVDEDDDTYTDLEIKGKSVSKGGSKKTIVNNKIEMLSADDDDDEDDDSSQQNS